jgi:hypothetical protein
MPARRADDSIYALLVNGSATGSAVSIKGGEYTVFFDGSLSGATVSLQVQSPSGQWVDVSVFTNNVVKYTNLPASQTGIDLPAGDVRCALIGGAPSGVNAHLVGLG